MCSFSLVGLVSFVRIGRISILEIPFEENDMIRRYIKNSIFFIWEYFHFNHSVEVPVPYYNLGLVLFYTCRK